ncbi:MAG: Ig-like domain-containing protein [Gemmatimonadota bacterium]|nr:Ig-like domain-containing protein [Gemmatimonadota bacterium]
MSQRVEAVTVTPGASTLTAVNATEVFTAEATDANGNALEDARFVWRAKDHSVATIGPEGTATAKGSGTSTITATAQDIPGHATLTVNQEIASLAFRMNPSNAVAGEAIDPAVQVEVLDADGAVIEDADLTISLELTGQQGSDPLRGSGSCRSGERRGAVLGTDRDPRRLRLYADGEDGRVGPGSHE